MHRGARQGLNPRKRPGEEGAGTSGWVCRIWGRKGKREEKDETQGQVKESEVEKSKEKKKEEGKGETQLWPGPKTHASLSLSPEYEAHASGERHTQRWQEGLLAVRLCNIRAASKKDVPFKCVHIWLHWKTASVWCPVMLANLSL